MFGNYGKLTVDQLGDFLLDLQTKEGEMYMASSTADKKDPASELHFYQRRVWWAMRNQLEAIVACVEQASNSPLYAGTHEKIKQAIKAVCELEREADSQKVTRRGVSHKGSWYVSSEIALHLGEKVVVQEGGKFLEVWSMDGKLIDGVPLRK